MTDSIPSSFIFPSFLQSPEWEELQRQLGRKTWRVQDILLVRHDVPYGFNYVYCPRPIFSDDKPLNTFLDEATKVTKSVKPIFLKIDPVSPLSAISYHLKASVPLQPRRTTILDITKPEEQLLAGMHEKTRYNIRLAERKEVHITPLLYNDASSDFAVFWKLLEETAKREGFHTHTKEYYEKLAGIKRGENISNELFFARYNGTIVASALVNFYKDPVTGVRHATYLHGASSREYREVMAPHLLHWRIMRDAKQRGCATYDFWGIDEKKWPGLTRFKLGFGGTIVEYPPSVEIPIRTLWYGIYSMIKRKRHA